MSEDGITVHGDGTIVATGDGIRMYDLITFRSALGLEIKTGIVMRKGFSITKQAIRRGYVSAGTRDKRKAYAQLDELIVANGGVARPLPPKEEA
jgi:hypothetical protein